jgi:hypothetical protein
LVGVFAATPLRPQEVYVIEICRFVLPKWTVIVILTGVLMLPVRLESIRGAGVPPRSVFHYVSDQLWVVCTGDPVPEVEAVETRRYCWRGNSRRFVFLAWLGWFHLVYGQDLRGTHGWDGGPLYRFDMIAYHQPSFVHFVYLGLLWRFFLHPFLLQFLIRIALLFNTLILLYEVVWDVIRGIQHVCHVEPQYFFIDHGVSRPTLKVVHGQESAWWQLYAYLVGQTCQSVIKLHVDFFAEIVGLERQLNEFIVDAETLVDRVFLQV